MQWYEHRDFSKKLIEGLGYNSNPSDHTMMLIELAKVHAMLAQIGDEDISTTQAINPDYMWSKDE